MKLSNKLLLGLLAFVLVSITILMTAGKHSAEENSTVGKGTVESVPAPVAPEAPKAPVVSE